MGTFTMKKKLSLIREYCPDIWKSIKKNYCPKQYGLDNNCFCGNISCEKCWNAALEDAITSSHL
jgi:hypothetical protein